MKRVTSVIHLDDAHRMGLTGNGIGIAIMDTGIGYHPDLIDDRNLICDFYDTVGFSKQYYDDNGHGTHIAGIIASSGKSCDGLYRGIAPGCHLAVVKVLNSRGEGNTENVLSGIEWILNNMERYRIRIVNISVGSTRGRYFDETSPLVRGVNKLWEAGLVVLTAAGNHGPAAGSIGAPGNSRKIITVGASNLSANNMDYAASMHSANSQSSDYSGRGPTEACIKKPDVVAPGSHVISCHPVRMASYSTSLFMYPKRNMEYYGNGTAPYFARSGTSMSTPVVTGCIALLLEKYPHMTNRDVKLHLKNTAYDLGYSHARQGWGMVRLDRLLV